MYDELRARMAHRKLRLGHLLWHSSRDYWCRMSAEEQGKYVAAFGIDWAPPNPSRDDQGKVRYDNDAGIDFLWMHRKMIHHARMIQRRLGEPDIPVWRALPATNDPKYRVRETPFLVTRSSIEEKRDDVWQSWLDSTRRLLAPESLKSITIGTLGTVLEYGVHAAMHRRFADAAKNGRNRKTKHRAPEPNANWDATGYDTLLDAYSSHVDPWFWGIHTWIDAQVATWELATQQRADLSAGWLGGWSGHATVSEDSALDAHVISASEDKIMAALDALPLDRNCGRYMPAFGPDEVDRIVSSLGR